MQNNSLYLTLKVGTPSEDVKNSFKSNATVYACILTMGITPIVGNIGTNNAKKTHTTTQIESYDITGNTNTGGLDMNENVSKDTFQIYKDSVEKDVEGIKSNIKDLATKNDLTMLQDLLVEKIDNQGTKTRNWILGGVITVLITIITSMGTAIWFLIKLLNSIQ